MHTARKYLTFLWMVLPAAHLPRKESPVKHAMKIPEVLLFVANVNLHEKKLTCRRNKSFSTYPYLLGGLCIGCLLDLPII